MFWIYFWWLILWDLGLLLNGKQDSPSGSCSSSDIDIDSDKDGLHLLDGQLMSPPPHFSPPPSPLALSLPSVSAESRGGPHPRTLLHPLWAPDPYCPTTPPQATRITPPPYWAASITPPPLTADISLKANPLKFKFASSQGARFFVIMCKISYCMIGQSPNLLKSITNIDFRERVRMILPTLAEFRNSTSRAKKKGIPVASRRWKI